MDEIEIDEGQAPAPEVPQSDAETPKNDRVPEDEDDA